MMRVTRPPPASTSTGSATRTRLTVQWLNDMSKMFAETGELTSDQCITYLVTLANSYRDAKLKSVAAQD
jgi:hypothetical protein